MTPSLTRYFGTNGLMCLANGTAAYKATLFVYFTLPPSTTLILAAYPFYHQPAFLNMLRKNLPSVYPYPSSHYPIFPAVHPPF